MELHVSIRANSSSRMSSHIHCFKKTTLFSQYLLQDHPGRMLPGGQSQPSNPFQKQVKILGGTVDQQMLKFNAHAALGANRVNDRNRKIHVAQNIQPCKGFHLMSSYDQLHQETLMIWIETHNQLSISSIWHHVTL